MTSLSDLPIHLWLKIFRYSLTYQDILNISSVSRVLHSQFLGEDYIWNYVCYNTWDSKLVDYGVKIPGGLGGGSIMEDGDGVTAGEDALSALLHLSSLSSYERARNFHRKAIHFADQMSKYNPEKSCNLQSFLEEFGTDTDYIPIFINYLEAEDSKLDVDPETLLEVDLARPALVSNLLITHSYRLGFQYMRRFMGQGAGSTEEAEATPPPPPTNGVLSPTLSDYELLWFKLSYFDKSSHKLIQQRMEKLAQISALLHTEVYVKDLLNGSDHYNGVGYRYSNADEKLTFVDEFQFVRFATRVISLALSTLGVKKLQEMSELGSHRYLESFFLEDFSILRVYANEVMGHPLVVYSILLKVLHDFLIKKFSTIHIDGVGAPSISLSKHFLQINNHFILLDTKTSLSSYQLKVFTRRQVISRLRSTHNIFTPEKIIAFLSPVSCKFLLEFYLTVDMQGYSKSMNSFIERQEDSATILQLTKEWYPHSSVGIYEGDYSLVKALFTKSREILSFFAEDCNFMFVKAFFDELEDAKLVRDSKDGSENNWSLFNELLHHKLMSVTTCITTPSSAKESTIDLVGKLVYHKKLNLHGIVVSGTIDFSGKVVYIRVFTQLGLIKVFRVESVRPDTDPRMVKDFLRHCYLPMLGLLYVKSYSAGKFEISNYKCSNIYNMKFLKKGTYD